MPIVSSKGCVRRWRNTLLKAVLMFWKRGRSHYWRAPPWWIMPSTVSTCSILSGVTTISVYWQVRPCCGPPAAGLPARYPRPCGGHRSASRPDATSPAGACAPVGQVLLPCRTLPCGTRESGVPSFRRERRGILKSFFAENVTAAGCRPKARLLEEAGLLLALFQLRYVNASVARESPSV